MKYLGSVVKEKELQIDEEETKLRLEFPTQKNVKQLQRIIEMTSWYRSFISKFSEIIELLQTLFKKMSRM